LGKRKTLSAPAEKHPLQFDENIPKFEQFQHRYGFPQTQREDGGTLAIRFSKFRKVKTLEERASLTPLEIDRSSFLKKSQNSNSSNIDV